MANTDDNFASFGTALDPIEDDEVARKKPITISEQIATDEQGRRRFHGAFTGGFSAGYYNTVGSKEGWTPSTFKSSRAERSSEKKGQNVTDYMDEEDMGAFGIAPQVLRQTDEFSTSSTEKQGRKRAKPAQSDGPIPGIPVLHQIIQPVKDTIGIRILVKMGWRPGQGVGPRVAKGKKGDKGRGLNKDDIEKPTIVEDIDMEAIGHQKVYGCQLPSNFTREETQGEESSDEEFDTNVLYAPADVESPLCNPKENTFGLGYKGLERMTDTLSHVDLFGRQLKFRSEDKSKNNKSNSKINLTGEAFGIGAFEEPDIDVYNREDLSEYDFELETKDERKARKAREELAKSKKKHKDSCIEGFHFAKTATLKKKYFPPPAIPHDFQPIHKARKSRFETTEQNSTSSAVDASKRGLGRHALTIQERQVLLGEEQEENRKKNDASIPTSSSSANVAHVGQESNLDPSIQERVERIKKFVQVLQSHGSDTNPEATSGPAFQPFARNPDKQERYEKYLTLNAAGFQDCLRDLQPHDMTEWAREREKQEFDRARAIYKPLSGVMSSRFVSAKSHDISHIVPEREVMKEKDPSEDPKVAARLNLFGRLTHTVVEWHPDKVLCKRFNIKDPFPDSKFVGLRGVSSIKSSTSSSTVEIIPTPPITAPAPKKSLFDNLDFSKPPPGLLPLPALGSEQEAAAGGESENGLLDAAGNRPVRKLEFQSKIAESAATTSDENENVPIKAPLDLFKQIFADSSESEPEDDAANEPNKSEPKTTEANVERRGESHSSQKQTEPVKKESKILFEKRYTRDPNNSNEKREKEKPKGKGIFDDLDFTKFTSKQKSSEGTEKNSLMGPGNESKGREEEKEDNDELLYGPKAPIKPIPFPESHSTTSHILTPLQPPKFSSSSTAFSRKKVEEEEVVWVEKEVVSQTLSKKKKHSTKKSKKSKSKKASKEKQKKNKKGKEKSKKSKHKGQSAHADRSSNSSDESDDSASSVEIHGSLNQKALLAQLKTISH